MTGSAKPSIVSIADLPPVGLQYEDDKVGRGVASGLRSVGYRLLAVKQLLQLLDYQ